MKNLQVNWLGVLAVFTSLVIVGHMNSKLIEKGKKENAPKTQIEEAIDDLKNDPAIIINHDSPEGNIASFEPELEIESTEVDSFDEITHNK